MVVVIKKIFNCFIVVIGLFIMFIPIVVKANIVCNDGTISDSCQDCHRGCCSHHGGCSNSSSSSNSSGNISNNSTVKPVSKSSDNSLKEVSVDYENVDISNLTYSTKKQSVRVNVVANDDKATIEYDEYPELTVGDNTIIIKVIAENGEKQNYTLIIEKYSKTEESSISIIVEIVFLGGLVYCFTKIRNNI